MRNTKIYEGEVPCNTKGYIKYEQKICRYMYYRGGKMPSIFLDLIARSMK